MNRNIIGLLGKEAGKLIKSARANFLMKLFRPNVLGAERSALRRMIGRGLQSGESQGLARLLGTDAATLEGRLMNRASGLYGSFQPGPNIKAQQYLSSLAELPAQRRGMQLVGDMGHSTEIARLRANLQNPEALQEAAKFRLQQRATNEFTNRADQIAMSGRHNVGLFKPTGEVSGVSQGVPFKAYKGFDSESAIRPMMKNTVGGPNWWSGYSGTARNYVGNASPFSYIAEARTPKLQSFGPSSEIFHPHIAMDTRRMPAWRIKNYINMAPQRVQSSLPYYEGVFTHSNAPVSSYSRLHKMLPSRTGFQTVGGLM